MINSLSKGKRFEREIVKLLSESFGCEFKRVPMSGAFSTTQKTKNPVFKGDVFTEDKAFNKKYNVVIECKRVKKLPKHDFNSLKGRLGFLYKKIVSSWIKQACRESFPKRFWLFFREDRGKVFVIVGYHESKSICYTSLVKEFKDFVMLVRGDKE